MLKIVFGILLLVASAHALDIPANDSRIYHTEYNWYQDKQLGFLETANPGAYIKVDFTGSSIGIKLDASLLNFPYCTLAWSIDHGPEQDIQLPAANNFVQLAGNLDKSKNHSLYLFVKNALQGQDRWFGPDVRIRIMSVTIDDGATIMTPTLAPKRLLAYWDSIGEGVAINGANGDLASNDAHVTWAYSLALAINVELSIVAWGAQGYTVGGMGNTPPLWNADGGANSSAWKWMSSKYPRSFDVCPDYIICGHGTNDGFRGKPDQVYTNALGWLQEIKQTCATSKLFLTVPFGRFMEDPIVRAYQTYQSTKSDPSVVLIQLGDRGSKGLSAWGATFEAVDGIHPWAWKSSQLGALLAAEIAPHLESSRVSIYDL
mmetsp:Transcript_69442/g.81070  ORF Transcript_69442/g.81070 Transcript_69442/m.81070 type:complete len:374 (+) Transcript_69442:24-1145(+)